jgi:hypothetical protein
MVCCVRLRPQAVSNGGFCFKATGCSVCLWPVAPRASCRAAASATPAAEHEEARCIDAEEMPPDAVHYEYSDMCPTDLSRQCASGVCARGCTTVLVRTRSRGWTAGVYSTTAFIPPFGTCLELNVVVVGHQQVPDPIYA